MSTDTVTETRCVECVTCSRCGGSGEYSFCQMYGTRCFKCGGKGKVMSVRGKAANDYLIRLRSKPASDVRPGDRIKVCDMWAVVTVVEPVANIYEGGRSFRDGAWVPHPVTPGVRIEGHREGSPGYSVGTSGAADTLFRVRQTAEASRETYRLAMDFQDTLTKAGTVKKLRGKKVAVPA